MLLRLTVRLIQYTYVSPGRDHVSKLGAAAVFETRKGIVFLTSQTCLTLNLKHWANLRRETLITNKWNDLVKYQL